MGAQRDNLMVIPKVREKEGDTIMVVTLDEDESPVKSVRAPVKPKKVLKNDG